MIPITPFEQSTISAVLKRRFELDSLSIDFPPDGPVLRYLNEFKEDRVAQLPVVKWQKNGRINIAAVPLTVKHFPVRRNWLQRLFGFPEHRVVIDWEVAQKSLEKLLSS